MHNCCLVNLEDMLQNGTVISETMIDRPKSFSTACNIATQAIAQIASSQYGGQSISLSHLAPFVDVSRQKFRKTVREELTASGIEPTEEMVNKIATLTGGRAAEEVVFHSVTTGASNDIEQATKLARAMITRYGMSDDFDMVALETVNNQYLGGDASLACSAETQTKIDQRVVELVKAQHEKAVNILTENRAKLDELAQYLYEKETITGEEFMNIVNAK